MVRFVRTIMKPLAVPLGIAVIAAGYVGLSYWWVVLVAAVIAIGFADQTLGIESPLERSYAELFPGPRYKDVVAGLFALAGSLAGLSVMYLIGRVFG